MLGKPSHHLRDHLEESGVRATATVIDIAQRGMVMTTGSGQLVSDSEEILKTRLRVEPPGEPPFEVEQRMRWPQMGVPSVGSVIAVIYDPDDHDKIMADDNVQAIVDARLQGRNLPTGVADIMHEVAGAAQQGASIADMKAMARQLAQQLPPAAGASVTPAPAAAEDPVDKLAKLADLKDRGILTEDEFNAQKARILGET
jgi:hypothetical protein